MRGPLLPHRLGFTVHDASAGEHFGGPRFDVGADDCSLGARSNRSRCQGHDGRDNQSSLHVRNYKGSDRGQIGGEYRGSGMGHRSSGVRIRVGCGGQSRWDRGSIRGQIPGSESEGHEGTDTRLRDGERRADSWIHWTWRHGQAHGKEPHQGRIPNHLYTTAVDRRPMSWSPQAHGRRLSGRRSPPGRHRGDHDAPRHSRRRSGAHWHRQRSLGTPHGRPRHRHEQHLSGGHQAPGRARERERRIDARRAGQWRRNRRHQRQSFNHGWRR